MTTGLIAIAAALVLAVVGAVTAVSQGKAACTAPSGKRTSIRWLPLSSFRPGLMNKR